MTNYYDGIWGPEQVVDELWCSDGTAQGTKLIRKFTAEEVEPYDTIVVQPANNGLMLEISINGTVVRDDVELASVSEIRVWGHDGNDHVALVDLAIAAMLDGGFGNDKLIGGAGHDILVAGEVDSGFSFDELRQISLDWTADKSASEEELVDDVLALMLIE